MALFRIARGNSSNLPTQATEGHCWFCVDTQKFYIDTASGTASEGTNRFALNANASDYVKVIGYGTCNTAVGTKAKTVTITSKVAPIAGTMILVKFTNGNSHASPTLNVTPTGGSALGAKPIVGNITAGDYIPLVYDGTSWNVIGRNSYTKAEVDNLFTNVNATNLNVGGTMVLSNTYGYGTSLPSSGTEGQIFFLIK